MFEIDIDPEALPVIRRSIGTLLARTDRFDLVPVDLPPDRHRITRPQSTTHPRPR